MGESDFDSFGDEPTAIRSTRKSRGKKAVKVSEGEEQEASEAELPQVANKPAVVAQIDGPAVEMFGEYQDKHGNKCGHIVLYWLTADHRDVLVPQPAILTTLMSDDAWQGGRFRPITQGYYAVQVMRYSEVPRHGYFTNENLKD